MEDVNTRNSTSSPLPSDRLRTSVIRQVTELCTRKFLPVLADNPAISSLTIVYYNNCAVMLPGNHFVAFGGGGGAIVQTSIKRPPPSFSPNYDAKWGGVLSSKYGNCALYVYGREY